VNVKFAEQMQALHGDLNNLRTDIKSLGTDLKYFSDRVEGVNKSVTGLDAHLGRLDAQLASFQATWSDPKALAESLKKAGVEGQKIVIVPLVPPPQPR
jgi:chromosome segregation ATPase